MFTEHDGENPWLAEQEGESLHGLIKSYLNALILCQFAVISQDLWSGDERGVQRGVFWTSNDDCVGERALNRTLAIALQGCPDSREDI